MNMLKLPLLVTLFTASVASLALDVTRENYISGYMSRGKAEAKAMKTSDSRKREYAYHNLRASYAFFGGYQNYNDHIYLRNYKPLTNAEKTALRRELTEHLATQFSLDELQADQATSSSATDSASLALMKLGVLGYFVLYLPDSPTRRASVDAFLNAVKRNGSKTYEVVHRNRSEDDYVYGNTSTFRADEHVIEAIAQILKETIMAENWERMNEILAFFEDGGQPSSLLKRLIATNGPRIFGEDAERAGYLLKVIKTQRPDLFAAAIASDVRMHTIRPGWGPKSGTAMARFFVERTDENLLRILKASGNTNLALNDSDPFSIHTSQFNLIDYLQSNFRLRDAFVMRALVALYSPDRYGPMSSKPFFEDLMKSEQGRQTIASVARRCLRLDPSFVRSREMEFMNLTAEGKEGKDLEMRLAYAGLEALSQLQLLTLEDVDFLVQDQLRGRAWSESFFKDNSYSLQSSIRSVLRAHGFDGARGFGNYLSQRHGLKYDGHSSAIFREALLTPDNQPVPLWQIYGLAFDARYLVPSKLQSGPKFESRDYKNRLESYRRDMVTALSSCEGEF